MFKSCVELTAPGLQGHPEIGACLASCSSDVLNRHPVVRQVDGLDESCLMLVEKLGVEVAKSYLEPVTEEST